MANNTLAGVEEEEEEATDAAISSYLSDNKESTAKLACRREIQR